LLTEAEALYRDGFAPRSLAENLATVLRDALRSDVSGESAAGFRLPIERSALLRLIHALDDEQDRFVRRDDLYSLEVALLKGVNTVSGNVPAAPGAGQEVGAAATTASADAPARVVQSVAARSPERGGANAGAADPGPGVAADPAVDPLPSFDPTGRRPAKEGRKSGRGADSASQGAAPSASEGTGARSAEKGKRLDWHAVRSSAGAQLKAFLMPARESVDGSVVTIRFGDTHKFHYNELRKREDELAQLIEQVGGPGYSLRIEGPGEQSAKKS
jgi:DNA polymerase-3 subunit gamma/tau